MDLSKREALLGRTEINFPSTVRLRSTHGFFQRISHDIVPPSWFELLGHVLGAAVKSHSQSMLPFLCISKHSDKELHQWFANVHGEKKGWHQMRTIAATPCPNASLYKSRGPNAGCHPSPRPMAPPSWFELRTWEHVGRQSIPIPVPSQPLPYHFLIYPSLLEPRQCLGSRRLV